MNREADIPGEIGRIGIIPVVVIDDEREAEHLAGALLEGGLPAMEITFRTDAARRAIERVAKSAPSILLGAGTVLTVDQAATAVGSGARYIVAPGLNRAVVEYCLKESIPVMPGVLTPTEIGTALAMGLRIVKFFPAEASGGVGYLSAVAAPYGSMKFIPTGGINETNAGHYLRLPFVHACGGSWMVRRDLVAGGRFDEVTKLASKAVSLVAGARSSRTGS